MELHYEDYQLERKVFLTFIISLVPSLLAARCCIIDQIMKLHFVRVIAFKIRKMIFPLNAQGYLFLNI